MESRGSESRSVCQGNRTVVRNTSSESRGSESRSASRGTVVCFCDAELPASRISISADKTQPYDTVEVISPAKKGNYTPVERDPMLKINSILDVYERSQGRCDKLQLSKLHSNQKLLLAEMITRGIDVEVVDFNKEIVRASYEGHEEYLYDRDSSIVPYSMSVIAGNKWLTKKILDSKDISVLSGATFSLGVDLCVLDGLFDQVNPPVVVKPVFGSHGNDIFFNIKTKNDLHHIVQYLRNKYNERTEFLIEEQFKGKEYRIFITKNGNYAVLEREPAYVIGNDSHSIRELINLENKARLSNRDFSVCPILLDDVTEAYLKEQGVAVGSKYILAKGVKRYVRPNSNVATGGLAHDRTAEIKPTAIEIAKKVLNAFPGLPYIGIDFMTEDISKTQDADSYRILEVNTVPGLDMHFRPYKGTSRNVAKFMVDLIYPETKGKVVSSNERVTVFHEVMKGCHCKLSDHPVLVLRDSGGCDYHSSDTLYDGLCPVCWGQIENTTKSCWKYLVINPRNDEHSGLVMLTDLKHYINFEREYTEGELLHILIDLYDPEYISYGKRTLYSRDKGILEQD